MEAFTRAGFDGTWIDGIGAVGGVDLVTEGRSRGVRRVNLVTEGSCRGGRRGDLATKGHDIWAGRIRRAFGELVDGMCIVGDAGAGKGFIVLGGVGLKGVDMR